MQPEILLTLSAGSLRSLLRDRDPRCPDIFALPQFTATDLQLRGLSLPADLLAGFGIAEIDRLRDHADRAHCPVLLVSEEAPIDFTDRSPQWEKSLDRLQRLATAAHRLGCPSLAVRASAPATDEAFEATMLGFRQALKRIERYELNLLLAPHAGLTVDPTRLTELIKKIGGFRIGSYPSFQHAFETGELEKTLRKLAPYAPAIAASVRGFDKNGAHEGYSLEACVESIRSVGYANTLALDYVPPSAPEGAGASSKKAPRRTASVDVLALLDQARRALEAASVSLVPDDEEE